MEHGVAPDAVDDAIAALRRGDGGDDGASGLGVQGHEHGPCETAIFDVQLADAVAVTSAAGGLSALQLLRQFWPRKK